jgi:hypothetical protein
MCSYQTYINSFLTNSNFKMTEHPPSINCVSSGSQSTPDRRSTLNDTMPSHTELLKSMLVNDIIGGLVDAYELNFHPDTQFTFKILIPIHTELLQTMLMRLTNQQVFVQIMYYLKLAKKIHGNVCKLHHYQQHGGSEDDFCKYVAGGLATSYDIHELQQKLFNIPHRPFYMTLANIFSTLHDMFKSTDNDDYSDDDQEQPLHEQPSQELPSQECSLSDIVDWLVSEYKLKLQPDTRFTFNATIPPVTDFIYLQLAERTNPQIRTCARYCFDLLKRIHERVCKRYYFKYHGGSDDDHREYDEYGLRIRDDIEKLQCELLTINIDTLHDPLVKILSTLDEMFEST